MSLYHNLDSACMSWRRLQIVRSHSEQKARLEQKQRELDEAKRKKEEAKRALRK